jgi:hypothetical protein
MLEFRPRVPARNYLARREQWRLLAWVMGIGLVVLAGMWFAKFNQLIRTRPGATVPSVDTRHEPGPIAASQPDAITILPPAKTPAAGDGEHAGAEVDAALLRDVRDDTPWIRSQEVDAWLNVWSVLGRSSDEKLARNSAGKVGFVELFAQPQAYRGKLVTVRGSARQAIYLEAARNPDGLKGYYRVVILPEGGPAEPMFVYALALPRGFPVGESIRAEVAATGYSFKRMVYSTRAASELRRAPVVMARSLAWERPSTEIASRQEALLGIMIAVTAIGVIAFFVVSFWASRTGVAAKAPRPDTLAPIDDRNVVGVNEALARLAEKQE